MNDLLQQYCWCDPKLNYCGFSAEQYPQTWVNPNDTIIKWPKCLNTSIQKDQVKHAASVSSIPLRRGLHSIFILDNEVQTSPHKPATSLLLPALNGGQESTSPACLELVEGVRHIPQPLPCAYSWHQVLDEAVQVLREGAAPGTAAQVDGEFSQRKHIPSGITAPKAAQVRQTPGQHWMQVSFSLNIVWCLWQGAGFQNTHTNTGQLCFLPPAVPKELSQAGAAAQGFAAPHKSRNLQCLASCNGLQMFCSPCTLLNTLHSFPF